MSEAENPPAFPREDYQANDAPGQRGMSLRDWFAGQALTGLVFRTQPGFLPEKAAKIAFAYADAMLAARHPTQEQG